MRDPLLAQTEKDFDATLFRPQKGVASMLGWSSYHTLRSKGSKAGYPDRTLWRDRVVFAELKTMARESKPSPLQVEILTGLAAAGAEVYLWRPSDLDEIALILGSRWTLADGALGRAARFGERSSFVPRSLWTPAGARADAA